jgi:hypothetical protein
VDVVLENVQYVIQQENPMRGNVVVLALAMMPFVTRVSKAQDPVPPTDSRPQCSKDPGNPSDSGEANRTKKCPPPPVTGTVSISGTVYFDLDPYNGIFDAPDENGIAGWDVVISGPSVPGGSMTYNTAADPLKPGYFVFAGLPTNATYTLCVVPMAGWQQTGPTSGGPTCTGGAFTTTGYTIDVPALAGDATVSDRNFGFFSISRF